MVQQNVTYAYDAVSMITQKVSRTASATNLVAYAYDELDRLVREDDGATAREYDYDLAGNRTAMRVIAGGVTNATAYTLGTGNRLATWTGGGACAYDTAGCVTNLVRSGKPTVALEWDARYRVTAAYTNGVLAESYGYDALGRRATVTANSVTTHYINEGPHVVAETDAAGNLLRRYEYGPGVDDILTMTAFSGGVTNSYYYIKDLQNTVWAIRDGAGEVVESYEYDAWGNVLAVRDSSGNPLTESAIGNRYLFQGREYSWTTGLYNFRARWYDPETGRWLSNDPIGISGGLNLYAFCNNNPVNYVDPFGLCENSTWYQNAWNWVLDKINQYGSVDVTFDAGTGVVGVSGNVSVTGSGLYGSISVGWGVGFGVSLTGNANFGNPSGWGFNGSVTGGNGVGGTASGTISQGGPGVTLGGGLGGGAGATVTFGYGGAIVEW